MMAEYCGITKVTIQFADGTVQGENFEQRRQEPFLEAAKRGA